MLTYFYAFHTLGDTSFLCIVVLLLHLREISFICKVPLINFVIFEDIYELEMIDLLTKYIVDLELQACLFLGL